MALFTRFPLVSRIVLGLLCAWVLVPLAHARAQAPSKTTQYHDVLSTQYLGCFKDTSAFDLDGYLERSATNTPAHCVSTCANKGFAYAAVQYGESCLCGNSYGRYGPATNCDYRCTGDGSDVCGGYSANSVFSTGISPPRPPPPPPGGSDCGPADPNIDYSTDRHGSNFMRYAVTLASCPQQCALACSKNARCVAWSFVRAGSSNAGCYLKNTRPDPSANDCCDSGIIYRGEGSHPPQPSAPSPPHQRP